jgi:1-acyl-sn-glycerol-3-phosphate acyltransferase
LTPVVAASALPTQPPQVGTVRAAARLAASALHALHGLAIVLLRFPFLDADARQRRIAWWADRLLRRMGLTVQVHGRFRDGAVLVVANHLSWLDIIAIHARRPQARFVAKADVRRWPLIRRLVDSAGTLYLERERRRDAMRVVHQVAAALQAGDTVAVFPEGTTGDGEALLPFHANLLQAAIAAGVPVQPVALRYTDPRHPRMSPSALWVGDTTLAGSIWALARADGLRVELTVLPALASAHADRRALGRRLQKEIGRALGLPDPAAAPPRTHPPTPGAPSRPDPSAPGAPWRPDPAAPGAPPRPDPAGPGAPPRPDPAGPGAQPPSA